jgi:hypothetical protein
MTDKRFYFLLGFVTAMFVAGVLVSMIGTPVYAGGTLECGDMFNPCYVKIVD